MMPELLQIIIGLLNKGSSSSANTVSYVKSIQVMLQNRL